MTRREILAAALAAPLAKAAPAKIPIGVTDWNLRLSAQPEAIPLAAQLGFDGIQISCGRRLVDDKMPLDNPEVIARCLVLSKQHKISIHGTCADRLHENGLKSDPLAVRWVRDSIRLTHAIGTRVLLLPFFGKWAILTRQEMDYTGDALRELAPEAEKADVVLGLENTNSAEDNVRIMDRARSRNVQVYYDVGNSTNNGFDILKEIRWLGKDRICQIHLKDNPNYLGEGKIQFVPVMAAIREIGFSGYAVLETDSKSPATLEADMRKNLAYVRGL
ncbi:MAG: sugar phosphate isomerase/epimerase [Candidatus Solibacter sp.]|nr:sugar phosphate isomerase/epimerase [Candidatus Solibacter sp.]